MRIIVLEKSGGEAELLCEALRKAFPNHTVELFMTFGDFLIALSVNSEDIDLIITEDRLALTEPRADYDRWMIHLKNEFPGAVEGWEAKKAPLALVGQLDQMKLEIPVVIYTHSEHSWINPSVWRYDASYMSKDVGYGPLFAQARSRIKIHRG